jgi:exodeoxyribonuclease VII small subunit
MQKSPSKAIEKMTYEEASAELEEVVAALESETRPLEEALALFERGQELVRRCTELLEQADLKIRQLAGGEEEEASETTV